MLNVEDTDRLNEDQIKAIMLIHLHPDSGFVEEVLKNSFAYKILEKRIEVMDLPIIYTNTGMAYLIILTEDNPGKSIVVLIDMLERNLDITVDNLTKVYPYGFYNYDSLNKKVKEHQDRKHKWSGIY